MKRMTVVTVFLGIMLMISTVPTVLAQDVTYVSELTAGQMASYVDTYNVLCYRVDVKIDSRNVIGGFTCYNGTSVSGTPGGLYIYTSSRELRTDSATPWWDMSSDPPSWTFGTTHQFSGTATGTAYFYTTLDLP